jgi:hypothetical protein
MSMTTPDRKNPLVRPSTITARPPPIIENEEQALRIAEEAVLAAEQARALCDPLAIANLSEYQRQFWVFLIRHGNALGVVKTLLQTEKISPIAYNSFVARVHATLMETMIG